MVNGIGFCVDSNQYGEGSRCDNGHSDDDTDDDDNTECGMMRRHRGESEGILLFIIY